MSTHEIITTICDGCLPVEVPATSTETLAVGVRALREIDLCDEHRRQWWEPMAALFSGAQVERRRSTGGSPVQARAAR